MNFGEEARMIAGRMSYTEYDAKEMAMSKAKKAGDNISEHCHEPRLDDLCSVLNLDTSRLDNPAVEFGPIDIALAAWSNWGAGSIHRAARKSQLTETEFIVLNDYFRDIVNMNEE